MKPSNRDICRNVFILTSTLSSMSNEFEGLMRYYEVISDNALDLAILANQSEYFIDLKENSETAKIGVDRNGQRLKSFDYFNFNITHTKDMGARPEDIAGIVLDSLR